SRILLLHIHLRTPLRTRAGPGRDIRTSAGDSTGRVAGGVRNEGEKTSLGCREGKSWFGSTCVKGGGTWEERGGNKALTRLGRMDGAGCELGGSSGGSLALVRVLEGKRAGAGR